VIRPTNEADGAVTIVLSIQPAPVTNHGKPVPLERHLRKLVSDYAKQHPEVTITEEVMTTSAGQKGMAFRFSSASQKPVEEEVWLEDPSGYTHFDMNAPDGATFARALPVLRQIIGAYKWLKAEVKH
jgi:hypothetical protein